MLKLDRGIKTTNRSTSLGSHMKHDALTLSAVVLILGIAITGFLEPEFFQGEKEPPTALQQGVAVR